MNKLKQSYFSAFLTAALLLSGFVSKAQSTIFLEKMGTTTANIAVAAHETANGFDNDALTMTTDGAASANSGDIRKSNNIGTDGADDANVWLAASGDRFFAIEGINASGYTNLNLEFYYRKEKATSLADLEVAYWNGTAYVPVTYTFAEAATAVVGWYPVSNIALPPAAQINNLKLRFKKPATSTEIRLDQVKLTGTAAATVAPTIASTLNNRANVFTTVQESFSVAATAGSKANQLVKVKMTLATPAQAADFALSYEATPGNFLPLTFNAAGEMEFGPATGFPLADATTNFKITFNAAGTYNYDLAIVDAATGTALAPATSETVTVAAFVNPTIASSLNGRTGVITGVQEAYSVTTVAGNMAGQMVKVKATLATPAQAADMTLEYLETANNTWYPLTFDANGVIMFGPAAGFPLANATSNFRVTYSAAGTYATTLEIVDAVTGVALVPATTESVIVASATAPTIASTLNGRAGVKTTTEETFSVTATAGSAAGQLVKMKMTLATPAQAADVALSYEATPGVFLPLTFTAAGEMEFGPAAGFPLATATTNFKVSFATAGTYAYTLAIVDAATGVALAPATSESVTVTAYANATIASTLNGLVAAVTNKENNFTVSTVAGDDLNKMVKIKIALTNPAQASAITLSYEATPGVFLPLTFDAAGESVFGPATGFPLADATTNFKIIFDAPGTYAYTLSIVDATGNTVLGTPASESVTILVNGVKEDLLAKAISVYPNPATTNLNVVLGSGMKADLSVLDLTGKVVAVINQVAGEATVNVASLKAGTYLLRVATAEGIATKRFVVIR